MECSDGGDERYLYRGTYVDTMSLVARQRLSYVSSPSTSRQMRSSILLSQTLDS